MSGIWAHVLGLVAAKAGAASNRAWTRADESTGRHRWTPGDEAAMDVLLKVEQHRYATKVGAR